MLPRVADRLTAPCRRPFLLDRRKLSRRPSSFQNDHPNYQRTRGNYVVNWGNSWFGQKPQPDGLAPFYSINGVRSNPGTVKFGSITDGTSNTLLLLLSEYLMAKSPKDNDWRGDIHNDDGVVPLCARRRLWS